MGGWVYIMASRRDGMLYVGVTAHLAARVDQHRRDVGSIFCRRFGIYTLVYAEPHDLIEQAIARAKAVKAWKRGRSS
ncbi:GIY-YIG nuclease family protein [Sphingomonas sp. MMS24-JH45]